MTTGVVLMAYGSPRFLGDVGPYLTDIRGGREPSAEAVASLIERYRRIGGSSPLLNITLRQAVALERELGDGFVVRAGMKHWHPYIRDAVEAFSPDDIDAIVGLALAPHYSTMSIGGYEDRLRKAVADAGLAADVRIVPHWYEENAFIEFAAETLRAALSGWGDARVIFTAHSLPERILAQGDPYLDQLLESSRLVAERVAALDYEFAFQSASRTGEPWLGPAIGHRIEAAATEGVKRVVVHPIGFTADHLEILYDVDVECVEKAKNLGLELRRTRSPNADPRFIVALSNVVRMALR